MNMSLWGCNVIRLGSFLSVMFLGGCVFYKKSAELAQQGVINADPMVVDGIEKEQAELLGVLFPPEGVQSICKVDGSGLSVIRCSVRGRPSDIMTLLGSLYINNGWEMSDAVVSGDQSSMMGSKIGSVVVITAMRDEKKNNKECVSTRVDYLLGVK